MVTQTGILVSKVLWLQPCFIDLLPEGWELKFIEKNHTRRKFFKSKILFCLMVRGLFSQKVYKKVF